LLRLPDVLVAILAADAAARLLAGLLGVALTGALALGILRFPGLLAGLALWRIAWLPAFLRRLALLAAPIFAGLRPSARGAPRSLQAGEQVLDAILGLGQQAGALTGGAVGIAAVPVS